MRTYSLIALLGAIHVATATIDLQKLTSKIETLENQAASNLQQLAKNINLKTLQQYDYLNILPKLKFGQRILEAKKEKIQTIAENVLERKKAKINYLVPKKHRDTIVYYGQRIGDVKIKELPLAFELRRVGV